MVLQECSPRLQRRPPRPDQVLRHCRLRDSQAELQQLAVDPRRTPQRIRAAHPPNQIPQFRLNRGPTPSASTLPCPVAPETLTVPPHHGLGPHHLQRKNTTKPRKTVGLDAQREKTRKMTKGLAKSLPLTPCFSLVAGAGFEPATFGL